MNSGPFALSNYRGYVSQGGGVWKTLGMSGSRACRRWQFQHIGTERRVDIVA